MKLAVLTALVSAALSAPALAVDWMLLGENINDSRFYIGRQSIPTMPNGYKRAWYKRESEIPNKFGNTWPKSYNAYNCIQRRDRNLSLITFNDESITNTRNEITEWKYAPPASGIEALLYLVCGK